MQHYLFVHLVPFHAASYKQQKYLYQMGVLVGLFKVVSLDSAFLYV